MEATIQLTEQGITPRRRDYRWKAIALPNEHGSWGILFEPLIAGMALAWSASTPLVALMFIFGFLARQPLKVYLLSLRSGQVRPHTMPAFRLALALGSIAALCFAGLLVTSPSLLWPLLLAVPLGSVQIIYDAAGKSRRLMPEMLGAVALSSSAAICALASGWTYPHAAALSALFVLRFIPSLLYVRERLKLEKGKANSFLLPVSSAFVAFVAIAALSFSGYVPRLPLAAFAVLLTRCLFGLTRFRQRLKAMQIGIFEVIYGLILVLAVIVGYRFDL